MAAFPACYSSQKAKLQIKEYFNVRLTGMKRSTKRLIILAVLILIALVISVYSISAHYVASYVHEYNGVLVWPTPGYTFLPWPTTPTGIVPAILFPVSETDSQYYRLVIQSGFFIVLAFLSWIAAFWKAFSIKDQFLRR